MADVVTLSDGTLISSLIGYYYDKVWLERLEANLCYDKYGEQRPLPEGQGGTVIWHALLNPAKGYALGEGVPPAASAVSTRKVSAVPVLYGDVKAISDLVDMTSVCPVVEEVVAALGYSAALTKDTMISDQIGFGSAASTGVANAASTKCPSVYTQGFPIIEGNSGTINWTAHNLLNGYYSTLPTIAHIRKAVTHLKKLNAMPFEDGNFRGIISPTVSDAIRTDTNFATWMAYTNRAAMEKGKLGVIEKVLFEESSQAFTVSVLASAWSNSVYTSVAGSGTLYGTLIFGKGAYGVTKIGGKDPKVTVVSGAEKSDPLNQKTLIGYKFGAAAKILNPSAGIILAYFN
jgi:N4-gp56 family major capsid protein